MNSINLKEIDGHAIICTIAKFIDAEYVREGAISHLEFKNDIGRGSIYSMIISKSLTAIVFDVDMAQDLLIRLDVKFKNVLNLLFCLEGRILHSLDSVKKFNVIDFRQNAIIKSQGKPKLISFPSGEQVKLSYIILSPNFASSDGNIDLRTMADKLINNVEFERDYLHLGRYCARTAAHVKKMMSVGTQSFSELIFKEAAILNIMASQIQRYFEDTENKLANSPLRGYDMDKVIAVENFINDNLSEKLSIEDLTNISGISAIKLQRGFRFLHGVSVNNYITDKRLQLATTLLEEDRYNVSEVVYHVGYTSRSYFSRIFKDKYGISPSEFLEQNRLRPQNRNVHNSL